MAREIRSDCGAECGFDRTLEFRLGSSRSCHLECSGRSSRLGALCEGDEFDWPSRDGELRGYSPGGRGGWRSRRMGFQTGL